VIKLKSRLEITEQEATNLAKLLLEAVRVLNKKPKRKGRIMETQFIFDQFTIQVTADDYEL